MRSESPLSSPTSLDCQKANLNPELEPLDTCYDVLQDAYTYQVPISTTLVHLKKKILRECSKARCPLKKDRQRQAEIERDTT